MNSGVALVRGREVELWGGVEATVNRIHDCYYDQLERSGHNARDDDVDRFAALGIKSLRYPVLWEHVAPLALDQCSWQQVDRRLEQLRAVDIDVIAGLLHHGSGPRYTSLVDPDFATKFATYAGSVAQRYPWLDRYTPINEMLTTARFSGLYGTWYPHGRDERTFGVALLAQCRATVLAMRAIRRVNPAASLLQTEDLGKTYSTATLAYQADFQNEFRWLAWDLMCGRVDREHALWAWLTATCGIAPGELLWFTDNPCPPELLGVNHYVTSDRFLDERVENFPARYHGGNDLHRYADIEASRSLVTGTGGILPLLAEAWQRYRLPLAITEVHIDATRDDQIRWLAEIWNAARAARDAGIDLRAVTAWALLGSFDWNSLLTVQDDYYEPGAFDIRGVRPRETAVGGLMRQLARGHPPQHPVLAGQGWWQRDDRFFCTPTVAVQSVEPRPERGDRVRQQPILISGATGTLGTAFGRLCTQRGLAFVLLARDELDAADASSVALALELHQPWAVVDASGYVDIDRGERDIDPCIRENVTGRNTLAAACAERDLPFLAFSSDMAFNYVTSMIDSLRSGSTLVAINDVTVSPTYVPDLVSACLDLLVDSETGTWHLTTDGAVTCADFAVMAAERAGIKTAGLKAVTDSEFDHAARRPAHSALTSERSLHMPTLPDGLGRYLQQRGAQ